MKNFIETNVKPRIKVLEEVGPGVVTTRLFEMTVNNMKKVFIGALCGLALLTACNNAPKSENLSGLKRADFQSEQQGKQTDLYTLTNANGMEVCVTNYGGRIVSIMVPDKDGKMQDAIIGYSNINDYALATKLFS